MDGGTEPLWNASGGGEGPLDSYRITITSKSNERRNCWPRSDPCLFVSARVLVLVLVLEVGVDVFDNLITHHLISPPAANFLAGLAAFSKHT